LSQNAVKSAFLLFFDYNGFTVVTALLNRSKRRRKKHEKNILKTY